MNQRPNFVKGLRSITFRAVAAGAALTPRRRFEPAAGLVIDLVHPNPLELLVERLEVPRSPRDAVRLDRRDQQLGLNPPQLRQPVAAEIHGLRDVAARRTVPRQPAALPVEAVVQRVIDEAKRRLRDALARLAEGVSRVEEQPRSLDVEAVRSRRPAELVARPAATSDRTLSFRIGGSGGASWRAEGPRSARAQRALGRAMPERAA